MPSPISVFSPETNFTHILIHQHEYGDLNHMLLVAKNRPIQLELFHTLLFTMIQFCWYIIEVASVVVFENTHIHNDQGLC